MMRRIAIVSLSLVVLVAATFAGYGWLSRRGGPSFSQGGAFGTSARPVLPAAFIEGTDPLAEAPPAETVVVAGQPTDAKDPSEPLPDRARASSGTKTAKAFVLTPPRTGTYRYAGDGEERVRFGAASPCSWKIGAVPVVVRPDGPNHILDITFSENRKARMIQRFGPGGIRIPYYGAAVTCLGIQQTSEDTYDPDPYHLKLPLRPGSSWHMITRTENRTEDVTGRIVSRQRTTVPAGTFDTYKVTVTVIISDGQTGGSEFTYWYAPSLGMIVREISHTEVNASDATFTSDYTLKLTAVPS